MYLLVKIPLRLIVSIFYIPVLFFRYVFTGAVGHVDQNEQAEDISMLLKQMNGLRFQNDDLSKRFNLMVDILSHHKTDISDKILSNKALDEHEKGFCLDLASSIHFLKKLTDSKAKALFMNRMKPAIKRINLGGANSAEKALIAKCQNGDENSFLMYFSMLVTRAH